MKAGSRIHRSIKNLRRRIIGKTDPRLLLLKRMPRSAVCAEIGVWKGEFSRAIQKIASPRRLHLIDPWAFQGEFPERMYGGAVATKQADMEDIYQAVKIAFQHADNVTIHRGYSRDVLPEFEDDYFDWVYVDGNHYYEYVLADLQLAFLKVRPGGVIAGDDYTWGEKDGFPVQRAVKDFVQEKNLLNRLEILGSQFMITLCTEDGDSCPP